MIKLEKSVNLCLLQDLCEASIACIETIFQLVCVCHLSETFIVLFISICNQPRENAPIIRLLDVCVYVASRD